MFPRLSEWPKSYQVVPRTRIPPVSRSFSSFNSSKCSLNPHKDEEHDIGRQDQHEGGEKGIGVFPRSGH